MSKSRTNGQATDKSNLTVDLLQAVKSRSVASQHRIAMTWADPRYAHHFPLFEYNTIMMMLKDPRVRFGLSLIKGPISSYTRFYTSKDAEDPDKQQAIAANEIHFAFQVKSETSKLEEFIVDQLTRFWTSGLDAALRAIDWGYSSSQVHYSRDEKGKIVFDMLEYYQPERSRVVTKNGMLTGIYLPHDKRYIPIPKAFHHVHNRTDNKYYGLSRLEGAHVPWHELWTYGGARDIRRLWFFKNSYDSGIMRYPEGQVTRDRAGNEIQSIDLAIQMMDNRLSGAFFVLPSTKGMDKDYDWDYEPPSSSVTPQGLLEYPKTLRDEILEGIGIPPEVIESANAGLGSATGRKVPFMAFLATLFPLINILLHDIRSQILPALFYINGFGRPAYSIIPIVPQVEQQIDKLDSTSPEPAKAAA